MTENRSTIIYKYRKVDERLYEMLIKHSLWFANPTTFNDPFDCNLNFFVNEASLDNFVLKSEDERTYDLRKNYSIYKKKLGVERLKELVIESTKKAISESVFFC